MISFIKFNVIIEILKYEKPMKLNHIKDRQVVNYFVIGDKEEFYDPTRVSKSHKKRENFSTQQKETKEPKRENVVRLYPRRYPVEEVAYRAVCGRDVIPRFRKIQMTMNSVLSGAPAYAAAA